jgi:hypothetical protein
VKRVLPILLLALIWGVGPAWNGLVAGNILGHGHTDLFPSIWGLWSFAQEQPGLPNETALLGHPTGMGYYFSSPIKGWIATLSIPVFGLVTTWNGLLILARIATVLTAWLAARAWGLGEKGSLAAAALYGCSPFFHGYAVEGIVEGTDGWTLAVWLWALGSKRFRLAAIPFALTILSSWYLGMVACLLLAMAVVWDRRSLWSAAGLLLVTPALAQFVSAFPGTAPIDDVVRASMGAQLTVPTPGLHDGLHPFAINTYIGFVALAAALSSRTRWTLLALIPALLSLGIGPIYELPVAELVRFPYRWHAATLVLLAPAVALAAEERRWGGWLPFLIVVEGLCLSPIEPIIPSTDPTIPAYTKVIDGPVIDIPGPVAMAPGVINRSRGRARYLMYYQTAHGQPSPWVPDFNSVGVETTQNEDILRALTSMDPLLQNQRTDSTTVFDPQMLHHLDTKWVVLHKRELGSTRQKQIAETFKESSWIEVFSDSNQRVFRRLNQPE